MLDVLIKIKDEQDHTLNFRRSCRWGPLGDMLLTLCAVKPGASSVRSRVHGCASMWHRACSMSCCVKLVNCSSRD